MPPPTQSNLPDMTYREETKPFYDAYETVVRQILADPVKREELRRHRDAVANSAGAE